MSVDKLKVRVHLIRYQSNTEAGGGFSLEVEDDASHIRFLRVDLPLGQAADLFSAREAKGVAELWGMANVGKRHENKTLKVGIGETTHLYADGLASLYDAVERDNPGWKAAREGWNHHRLSGRGGRHYYEVHLHRYVGEGT